MTTKSRPSVSLPAAAIAAVVAAMALPGCGMFKGEPDAQAVVNQRLLGMATGEFIDRFGRVEARTEMPDGSFEFNWQSKTGVFRPGMTGGDEPLCKLHVVADRRHRVVRSGW